MRIGIDCRLWNETGVGRYIRNLVEQLAEIDKQNEYVLFMKQHEYASVITPGNNFRKRLADVRWHSLQEQSVFLKHLYQENLDVMHFPYFSFPILYQRPFIITIHDLILFHYPTGKASQLPKILYDTKLFAYKQLMYHAAKQAKKIIAVSNATKDEIITQLHADPSKIIVTYEGCDLSRTVSSSQMVSNVDQMNPNEKEPILQDSNRFEKYSSNSINKNPYFLYVGNAYPHKNLNKFLTAFAELSKEVTHVDLVLVGKEDYFYQELKRNILRLRLENNVHILTNITDEDLMLLYQHAIALVMPSLMEGFGLPVVEAMANNCFVAASAIPALKEICGEAAIYFDPQNREDIKKALQYIFFNQQELIRYKQIALGRASLFSWRTMAEQTLKMYESIPPDISFKATAKEFKHS